MPLFIKSTKFTGLPANSLHLATGLLDLPGGCCPPPSALPRIFCRTLVNDDGVFSRSSCRQFTCGIIPFQRFEDVLKAFETSYAKEESPHLELVLKASVDLKLEISPLSLSNDTHSGDLYEEGAKQYARP
jgi:hypothetical protein